MRQLPLSVRLHERAVFGNFLPGPNAEVVTRLAELARQPQPGLYWLHGPAGSGKSHLLQAVCAAAGSGGAASARYLPLVQLAPFGAAALQDWQGAGWLCVDELGTVIGHPDWERALFNLYRDSEERAVALIVAARERPTALRFALPDLASRCLAGTSLALQPLDDTQQAEVLRRRAQQRGFELPEETTRFLQRRLPRDLRTLCAVLDELDSAALVAQRRLTIPFIREVLQQRPAWIARRCRVTGVVQGVNYRAATARHAAALGVGGHAYNQADGSVEVLACGAAAAVRELIGWLWVGPYAARVASVIESEVPATGPEAPRGFTTA